MASDTRQSPCNFLFTPRSLQVFALDLFSNTNSLYLLGVCSLPLFSSFLVVFPFCFPHLELRKGTSLFPRELLHIIVRKVEISLLF